MKMVESRKEACIQDVEKSLHDFSCHEGRSLSVFDSKSCQIMVLVHAGTHPKISWIDGDINGRPINSISGTSLTNSNMPRLPN